MSILAKADQWLGAIEALGKTFETGFTRANKQADHILDQCERLDKQTKDLLKDTGTILEDTKRIQEKTRQYLKEGLIR